ncbi:hypothetical protein EYF80_026762 [Liparis tanakae]|uniref:Uncharacterized protein n=1 Tax=Liparis tanakae TaxID=230148 RepID=A0A4Z2HDR1_9TELE|nr:hypothetical protein EYF80_026762 [Liparis tanakae]
MLEVDDERRSVTDKKSAPESQSRDGAGPITISREGDLTLGLETLLTVSVWLWRVAPLRSPADSDGNIRRRHAELSDKSHASKPLCVRFLVAVRRKPTGCVAWSFGKRRRGRMILSEMTRERGGAPRGGGGQDGRGGETKCGALPDERLCVLRPRDPATDAIFLSLRALFVSRLTTTICSEQITNEVKDLFLETSIDDGETLYAGDVHHAAIVYAHGPAALGLAAELE